nr:PspC domain-containing protein [Oscillospiraceae bacterium]
MEKKLYRSANDKLLAGVCAGLAKYLNMDPTVIRVIWAVLSLFAFVGVIAYIVCALVIPEEPTNVIDAA